MDPGKPHLLQIDPRLGRPQRRLEVLAVLVDGHHMTRMVDDDAWRRVVEQIAVRAQRAEKRCGNAQRPDRIEYPDKVNTAYIHHGMITPKRRRPLPRRRRRRTTVAVQVVRLAHPVRMLAPQNAAI